MRMLRWPTNAIQQVEASSDIQQLDMFKETQRCETLCEVACDYDGVAYHCKDHRNGNPTP